MKKKKVLTFYCNKLHFFPAGGTGAWAIFALTPYAPLLLDTIIPLENGSKRRFWRFHSDYLFFDKDNYYYVVSTQSAIVYFSIICLFLGLVVIFLIIV